jgi:photosystem II stability/assembly factor-like uncharacterized protein
MRRDHLRRRRLPDAFATLVAIALVLAGCTGGHITPTASSNAVSTTIRPITAPSPGTTSATPSPPPGFRMYGVSFISDTVGWALGQDGCTACATVLSTIDGGRTWRKLPSIPQQPWFADQLELGSADIAFADTRNGFMFTHANCPTGCVSGVIATHDGGHTWRAERLPALSQVAIGAGIVYALTASDSPVLWHTRLGSDTWLQLPQPSHATGLRLAVSGTTLLLLRSGLALALPTGGDPGSLWTSNDRGTRWTSRPVPCNPREDGTAELMSIALNHPVAWLVDCYDNRQSQQEQDTSHHLYGTADAGETWVRLADPSRHGGPALLADNGAGHAFLATRLGLNPASTLYASLDGAATWHAAIAPSGGSQRSFVDLAFTSAQVGYVAAPTSDDAARTLYRTVDAGAHWTAVLSIGTSH